MPTRNGSSTGSLRSEMNEANPSTPAPLKLKPVQTEALALLYAYQKRWTSPHADMLAGYSHNLYTAKSVAGVMGFLWKKGLVERSSSGYGKIYKITENGMKYLTEPDIKKAKDLVD